MKLIWHGSLLLLLLTLPHSSIGQNRSGALSAFSRLSAAPGSEKPSTLSPNGKPWVVFIFKACCSPADQAAKWLVNTEKSLGDSVNFIGLNIDNPRTIQRVKNWLAVRTISFPVVRDPTGQAAVSWSVLAPPSVIILDINLNETYRTMGFMPSYGKQLEKELNKLLSD